MKIQAQDISMAKRVWAQQERVTKENNELNFWFNSIDWSKWWLYNTHGGLCEWGIDNGFTGALHEDLINNPKVGQY